MTYEFYTYERERLQGVLHDARQRGDYYLETDVCEALQELETKFDEEREE